MQAFHPLPANTDPYDESDLLYDIRALSHIRTALNGDESVIEALVASHDYGARDISTYYRRINCSNRGRLNVIVDQAAQTEEGRRGKWRWRRGHSGQAWPADFWEEFYLGPLWEGQQLPVGCGDTLGGEWELYGGNLRSSPVTSTSKE